MDFRRIKSVEKWKLAEMDFRRITQYMTKDQIEVIFFIFWWGKNKSKTCFFYEKKSEK